MRSAVGSEKACRPPRIGSVAKTVSASRTLLAKAADVRAQPSRSPVRWADSGGCDQAVRPRVEGRGWWDQGRRYAGACSSSHLELGQDSLVSTPIDTPPRRAPRCSRTGCCGTCAAHAQVSREAKARARGTLTDGVRSVPAQRHRRQRHLSSVAAAAARPSARPIVPSIPWFPTLKEVRSRLTKVVYTTISGMHTTSDCFHCAF